MTKAEALKIRTNLENAVQTLSDKAAFEMRTFYPAWAADVDYTIGYKVQYHGKLYKVITAHTSQAAWIPDAAVTLFERIDETHDGSKYDPIPYDGNMVLTNGLYYTQDGVLYLCTRDTGNPVYNSLADLVGLYVDRV